MNHFRKAGIYHPSILILFLLILSVGAVQAQNVPHLTVTITGQTLTAGFNNNVTINVLNTYFTAIYDVDIALAIPSGLTMFGDSHRHYDSMQLGQSVTVNFQVYAPTAAIGNSYQGSVTISYKQLGDIAYTQEAHALGFSAQGWIHLILYGVQLTPSISTPGGNATISGNLLNTGNLAAYNANVTLQSEIVQPSALSSAFLGEVDPNIPRPFSVLVVFKSNVRLGNYTLTVKATAVDNGRPASPYTAQATPNIEIRRPSQTGRQVPSERQGPVGILLEIIRYLIGIFFGSSSFRLGASSMVSSTDFRASRNSDICKLPRMFCRSELD